MSTLSIRLPDSLHRSLRELSQKEHISINQFISSAVAEKITALETEQYLERRAASGSEEAFKTVLSRVSSQEPEVDDSRESDT